MLPWDSSEQHWRGTRQPARGLNIPCAKEQMMHCMLDGVGGACIYMCCVAYMHVLCYILYPQWLCKQLP